MSQDMSLFLYKYFQGMSLRIKKTGCELSDKKVTTGFVPPPGIEPGSKV